MLRKRTCRVHLHIWFFALLWKNFESFALREFWELCFERVLREFVWRVHGFDWPIPNSRVKFCSISAEPRRANVLIIVIMTETSRFAQCVRFLQAVADERICVSCWAEMLEEYLERWAIYWDLLINNGHPSQYASLLAQGRLHSTTSSIERLSVRFGQPARRCRRRCRSGCQTAVKQSLPSK